jgi:hypothetical protein
MPKTQSANNRPDLANLRFQPVAAQLRPSVPTRFTERRNRAARHALLHRVHSEFLEMPGLILSIEQAARLFSLPSSVCARVFVELVDDDLLRVATDGRYALARRST